jgi:serine/threonine protein kinase/Tol biopolymer transport system component
MPRTLKPEDRLSHYRIIGPLGAGGMGEVYRARDQKLERDVALKILPPELVASGERVRRFMLEAKSASSLNHPHIVTIHEIGQDRVARGSGRESDSAPLHFIAMELVNGKTLAAQIHEERTDLKTLLGWLAQAAEGLAKAHAAGIVHRDLKPGNIMVSQDGYAKVLDFGLAKLAERPAPTDESAATTMTAEHTSDGVVLGTAGYMAPEQVQGKPVDHRADVFAFGCMLYEAATRRQPFAAESKVETMHRILHAAPAPIEDLNPEAPAELRRLIRRCLAKDPNQRLDSMRTLALELREIVEEYDLLSASASSGSGMSSAAAAKRRDPFMRMGIPIVVLVVVALASWLLWKHPWQPVSTSGGRPPEWKPLTFVGRAESGDLSPDGNAVAYVVSETDGRSRLMVQDVRGGEAIPIFEGQSFSEPRWSGDGSDIVLVGRTANGSIGTWRVPRMGGQPRALTVFKGGMARLSPGGDFVAEFATFWRRILITRLSNGDTTGIQLEPRYTWLQDVEWSPDGKMLLVVTTDEVHTSLWTMKVDGRAQRKVHEASGGLNALWAPRGNAIYCVRQAGPRGELVKIYLTPEGGASRKPARVLISEPGFEGGPSSFIGVSRDGGRMVCTRNEGSSNLWLWDRGAGARGVRPPPRQVTHGTATITLPAISPDGQRAAFLSDRGGVTNVHVLDLMSGSSEQVTFMEHDVSAVVWSRDGQRLAFTCVDGDTTRVWQVAAHGGRALPFSRTGVGAPVLAWAPVEKLLYERPGNRNFSVLTPGSGVERPLVANDSLGWMFSPAWSPDGKRVAVYWNRQGAPGLWVVSIEDTVQTRLLASRDAWPKRWSDDGSSVLAMTRSSQVLRVGYPRADTTTALRIPLESDLSLMGTDFTSDLRRCVYAAGQSRSDIWLLENFDPEVR